jgi:hypothetical protein
MGTIYWRNETNQTSTKEKGWVSVNAQFTTSYGAANQSAFGRLSNAYISYSPDCVGMKISE